MTIVKGLLGYFAPTIIKLTLESSLTGKTISAIRFSWNGLNAFGEPAEMAGVTNGFGGGFTDNKLRPAKQDLQVGVS